MARSEDVQKQIERLQRDQDRAAVELRNTAGALEEARARRRQLWADADVDGKDTAGAVAKLSRQTAEREEQVERLQAGQERRAQLIARAAEELQTSRRAEGQREAHNLVRGHADMRKQYIADLRAVGAVYTQIANTEREIARLVKEHEAVGLSEGMAIPAAPIDYTAHAAQIEDLPATTERKRREYAEQQRRSRRFQELQSDPEYQRLLVQANGNSNDAQEETEKQKARRRLEQMMAS